MRRALALSAFVATAALAGCFLSLKEYPVEGAGGAGGSATPPGALGQRCAANAPCEEGLECWEETATPGGPPGGVCTKTCIMSSDCPGNAHCYVDYHYCFLACTRGDGNVNKCEGRRDLACALVSGTQAIDACVPFCSDDGDCSASGRICDRFSGMCTLGEHSGLPVAAKCTQTSMCRGGCVTGACNEFCVIGAAKSCDQSAISSTVHADCVGSPGGDTGIQVAVGDLAICAAECQCAADCPMDILKCATSATSPTPHCLESGNPVSKLCR